MTRSLLFVALILAVSAGCRKVRSRSESDSGGNQGGSQGGSGFGAEQAVRGAVNRSVTQQELHDLHIFLNHAKVGSGRVPTAQETMAALNRPDGNRQLAKLIQDGVIVLVPNPQDEGLWAYGKEAPTHGGLVLTHTGVERVTANDFNTRFGRQ